MEANTGYVVAGYLLTAVALVGYALRLMARARAAARRPGSATSRGRG